MGYHEEGFKNIVAAVDGSDYSMKAAIVAAEIAKKFDAKLTYVTVLAFSDFMMIGGNISGQVLDKIYSDSMDKAKQVVAKAVDQAKSLGLNAYSKVISDASSVVQAIVEFSEKENADLIVLGTRGMSGFKKLVLGSVSSGVAGHAHCSVLIVR